MSGTGFLNPFPSTCAEAEVRHYFSPKVKRIKKDWTAGRIFRAWESKKDVNWVSSSPDWKAEFKEESEVPRIKKDKWSFLSSYFTISLAMTFALFYMLLLRESFFDWDHPEVRVCRSVCEVGGSIRGVLDTQRRRKEVTLDLEGAERRPTFVKKSSVHEKA